MKKLASLFAALALLLALAAPGAAAEAQPQTGRIYLYGETHADPACLLFIEVPSYAAAFMNLWMKAEDDAILSRLFEDWEGAAMHSQDVWDFYKAIKERCPETVFHGFDVGHQYNTTGARYLIGLALTGQMGSADWDEAQRVIDQGKQYYQTGDNAYRENAMTENLTRAFEALPMGASVMVITGSAHSNLYAMDYYTGAVPCMANQLRQQYGAALVARNLSAGIDYARAGETAPVRRLPRRTGPDRLLRPVPLPHLLAHPRQLRCRRSPARRRQRPAPHRVHQPRRDRAGLPPRLPVRRRQHCAVVLDGALWQDIPVTTGFAA